MTSTTIIEGRFVLEAEHKRGGMGAIWRASDLNTGELVAVKIVHAYSAAEQAQRFVREATLLAELAHPSVVAYVAHGTTSDGVPYLAMEWLEGENVAERLTRQRLTLPESMALVRAATRALCVAHERGVIHRDLKPSNLFLRQGRLDDVVLLDLGIARPIASRDDLTRTGSILGTPSYMAPEQAQGATDIGPAADVFSLGCILYECLTGEPPFVGEHVLAVLTKVLFEETPRLRDVEPAIPLPIEELVELMLRKDRAQRPADAMAVRHALDRLEASEPTLLAATLTPLSLVPRPSPVEQELVSVILATHDQASEGVTAPALELSAFGGELKRLADGTTVVTFTHRRGAATDLAVRAARCALRLRDSAPEWNIVLATGRAVPVERVHVGEAVDRAATLLRARSERRESGIWIDEVTAGLLDARFRVAPVTEGIVALEGEEPTMDSTRPLLGLPTACVGREHELATLELMLRACVDESSPQAILVTAPPGMGKTRLQHEFVRRLHAAGNELCVLLGVADPIRTSSGFDLLGSALARRFGLRDDAARAENRARLEGGVARHVAAADRVRTAVFLGELCGVGHDPGTLPELGSAQQVPQQMARLIEQAWLTFLRAEAAAQPVLIVLDNLQWSDALTISLVGAALRELASSPVMVLALARPDVSESFPELWAPRLATLPLRPLAEPAMARLVRQVLPDRISDQDARRIVSRAAGNALYLEELIRAAATGRETVPETVVAMLQARIAPLAPTLRRVLRAASVFGETFPVAGVEALVRENLAEDEVARCLRMLIKHEIVERRAEESAAAGAWHSAVRQSPLAALGVRDVASPTPPQTTSRALVSEGGSSFSFRHALMRDAAYGLFTAEDRLASHLLAARFLVEIDEDPGVIAAHFELAGQPAEAIRHYVGAAEQAYRRADHMAIRALVDRALAAGAADLERGVLLSIEAPTLLLSHALAGSWAAACESLSLLPPRHHRRTQSLGTAAFCGMLMGKADEVAPFVSELYATTPEARDRAEYTSSVGFACMASIIVAERRSSTRLLSRIAQIDAQLGGDDLIARGSVLFCRGLFLQCLGDSPYDAWTVAQHSSAQQRAIGNRRLLSNSLLLVGEAARWLFSVDEGARALREAVKVARDSGETVGLDYLSQSLAMLLAEHGSADELAEARELAMLPIRRASTGGLYRALGLAALARLELRQGELGAAEANAREARALLRTLGHRAFWPKADRVLLEVLMQTGDPAAGALADEAFASVASYGPLGHLDLPLRQTAARAYFAVGRRDDGTRSVGAALTVLRARAAKIPTAAMRERFLNDVPENAALRALALELGVESPAP